MDFNFTPLWDQTEGQWLDAFTLRGSTPVDALLTHWATCLPDTVLSSPWRCDEDGHIYHARLNEDGNREITIVAQATRSTNTLR